MAGSQASLPPGIKKEITRHPSSLRHLPPQDGDEVELKYTLSLKVGDREVDSSSSKEQPFVYKVGFADAIEGLALGVKTMRKGEHARFVVAAPHAYGEAGNTDLGVPPNSTMVLEVELVKCPLREDLFEDGGAIKLEVRDAPDGRHPRPSDEVQITYKVTVTDSGVIMNQKGGVYKIGGEQIGPLGRVFDKALLSMKRGDEVLVTCQPQYTFAAGQYKGKVAVVSIALEEIFEVHDMSLGKHDSTVLRKRIKEGSAKDRIHDTTTVTLDIVSVSSGAEKLLKDRREVTFKVGNGQECDALEGSVVGMRVGDEAVLKVVSVEACRGGSVHLPEHLETPVMFHIAIKSFDRVKEKWDLSSAERIQRGRERKEVATELFKRGRTRLACHHYELIADLYTSLSFFQAEEQPEAQEMQRLANLNRAMCMLKLGDMKTVRELCTTVLGEDAANPKALFRRAKAALALNDYEDAIVDCERLLEVEPSSRDGRELLREAKRLRKRHDSLQTSTFAKMCAGLGDLPERVAPKGEEPFVAPDLDAEYAKLAAEHGLPYHWTKQGGSVSDAIESRGEAPAPAAAEASAEPAAVAATGETPAAEPSPSDEVSR